MDLVVYLFFVVVIVLLAATILFLLMLGLGRLESAIGILGDGIRAGDPAPSWSLPDTTGIQRCTPSHIRWQFLIFADTSLGGFQSVVSGIETLSRSEEIEVLVFSRDNVEFCRAMARGLNLSIPVIAVSDHFYELFRVRVMPFGTLIDPDGIVQWAGLVNTEEYMRHIWQWTRTNKHKLVAR